MPISSGVIAISSWYSIARKPDTANRKPEEDNTTKLNIEMAVAKVRPRKINPSIENPDVNSNTSPIPSRNAAIDKGTISINIMSLTSHNMLGRNGLILSHTMRIKMSESACSAIKIKPFSHVT